MTPRLRMVSSLMAARRASSSWVVARRRSKSDLVLGAQLAGLVDGLVEEAAGVVPGEEARGGDPGASVIGEAEVMVADTVAPGCGEGVSGG